MPHFARLEDGVVKETSVFDTIEGRFHPSVKWVKCDSSVSVGDRYDKETGSFSPAPQAVVKIGANNQVRSIRKRPLDRIESEDGWVKSSTPPSVEPASGYQVVRFYYPDTDSWDHEFRKKDPDDLRRNYTGAESRKAVRDALDSGDTARAIEEVAHILTGDDMFDR